MSPINNAVRFYSSPLHFQGDPGYGSYSKGAKGDKGHGGPEVSYCVKILSDDAYQKYLPWGSANIDVVDVLVSKLTFRWQQWGIKVCLKEMIKETRLPLILLSSSLWLN